jgi:hypothetical protein
LVAGAVAFFGVVGWRVVRDIYRLIRGTPKAQRDWIGVAIVLLMAAFGLVTGVGIGFKGLPTGRAFRDLLGGQYFRVFVKYTIPLECCADGATGVANSLRRRARRHPRRAPDRARDDRRPQDGEGPRSDIPPTILITAMEVIE